MSIYRGPESQISRSWNLSPESETQCPFIEVLKPRFWEWNPVSIYRGLETRVLRTKCNNAGLQAWADCVRPSRVPTSFLVNLVWCTSTLGSWDQPPIFTKRKEKKGNTSEHIASGWMSLAIILCKTKNNELSEINQQKMTTNERGSWWNFVIASNKFETEKWEIWILFPRSGFKTLALMLSFKRKN